MNHDVAVAWNWEHDTEFVADLGRAVRERGLSFRSVMPEDVEGLLVPAEAGALKWGVLLDRAWESDARFRRLNDLAAAAGTRLVNPPELSARMGNKLAMGALLRDRGVPVPRVVDFLPEVYSAEELSRLTADWKRPLWLKPGNSGGGDGVLELGELPGTFPHGAEWLKERFLVQEHAGPIDLAGRPAWFRVITVFGKPHAFWWHPSTHAFTAVTESDVASHGLACVLATARAVAEAAGMEIFSTEIALTAPRAPLVVDPVNDPVDFRRKSKAADAIPDEALAAMIADIADGLAAMARR